MQTVHEPRVQVSKPSPQVFVQARASPSVWQGEMGMARRTSQAPSAPRSANVTSQPGHGVNTIIAWSVCRQARYDNTQAGNAEVVVGTAPAA